MSGGKTRKAGADWGQVKTLVSLFIRLDLRGRGRPAGQKRRMSPLIRSLFFYGFLGVMLSAGLVNRVDSFHFSFLVMAYSMVMMAFSVILEFGYSFLQSSDDILMHRPVSERTVLIAKALHLNCFVLLVGGAIVLIPSLVGLRAEGAGPFFPLFFFLFATIGNLASASFVLLIYMWLMGRMDQEKFKDVLAYLHVVIAFLLFFGYNLIPRMGMAAGGTDFASEPWMFAAPPAWFAGAVEAASGNAGPMTLRLGATGITVAVLLVLVLSRTMTARKLAFRETGEEQAKPAALPKTGLVREGKRFIENRLPCDPELRAGYRIVSVMFRRDRYVKTGVYPLLGLPLAVFVLAMIQNEINDPFVEGVSNAGNFSSMVGFFLFLVMFFSVRGMIYSQDWEAGWVFHAAPIAFPGRFYQGVKLAVFFRVVLPLFILLGVLYCTHIPWLHGLQHTLSLFLLSMLSFAAASFPVRDFPFSKPRVRGEQSQRFLALFFVMPLFVVTILIQIFAYRTRIYWWILQALLCILFVVVEHASKKTLDRKLRRAEFLSHD